MTPEQLDAERGHEARRIVQERHPKNIPQVNEVAREAARLAREGWTPPEPVDPDILAAREWLKSEADYVPNWVDAGNADNVIVARAYLAGCTRGREDAKGLVEALGKQVYTLSQSHGGGARVIVGFLTIDDAGDAHEALAALASAKRGG